MLRSDLRPKAALRPCLRWCLPLLAAIACNHSDPFQPGRQNPSGPRTPGLPRQLTYSFDPDGSPALSGDGTGWLYAFTLRPHLGIVDQCLAGLPLEGGGQTRTYCDVTVGRLGLNATLTWPAENRSGRLEYLRSRGVPNGGATLTTDLILGSFDPRDSGQVMRHFPYHFSTDGLIRSLSHLGWLDGHTLIFLATDILHPGQASQDTLESGIQIERLDVHHPTAAPDVMVGTANASSVNPATDGSGFYFTLDGDTRVYRRTLSSGATTTVYDFGALGIARDARVADSVLYAVVGGDVQDTSDPVDGLLQDDNGGNITRVDLRNGSVTTLDLPGYLARFPAVSGDHTRILVQALPARDLWLLEAR
jgi:hypothetical protein